jgi:hypothetical protein
MTPTDVEKFNVEVLQEFRDYLKEVRKKQKEIGKAQRLQAEDDQLREFVRIKEEE